MQSPDTGSHNRVPQLQAVETNGQITTTSTTILGLSFICLHDTHDNANELFKGSIHIQP